MRLALERGARVICASHLGKAKGKPKPELSLAPVAVRFAERLGRPVRFVDDCVGPEAEERAAGALAAGEVLLLENLRFHAGEEANDPAFAREPRRSRRRVRRRRLRSRAPVARLGRRRAASSSREKGAGLLLEKEVRELSRLLEPERPFAAILGGAKISGKIDTLRVLSRRADMLLVGGGMANHFVRAIGLPVGKSLLEEDKVPLAREILDSARKPAR